MEDEQSVKKEEDANESEHDAVKPASPSKKRTATGKDDVEEATASDVEEPPSKKARQKPAEKPKQKKGIAVKKTAAKTAVKMEPVEIDEDEEEEPRPAKKSKVVPKKASPKPASPIQETEASDVEDEEPTKRKTNPQAANTKTQTAKVVDSTPDADVEAEKASEEDLVSEAESEEEDEKPEVAAKARAKVQSTLKSTGKEAYPDWKTGDPVPYAALCTTFSKIELTTKRLEIMAHCSAFMRQVARLTPEDLQPTVLLMVGKLAADYAGIELGIGESLIMKAIGESTGRNLKIIKEDQQKIGDLGLVAAKSRSNQPTMFKPKPLTVRGVHEGLLKIATVEGQGAQGRKVDGIKKLLSSADTNLAKGQSVDITKDKGGPSEAKFIIRALEGKMRLGLADKTVQVSLAHAMVFHAVSKDNNKIPSEAYQY